MDKEKIIGFDFQGWPIEKMTLREVLTSLGATLNEETGKYEIPNNEKLDIFPVVLEDDGMGYGVDDRFITEATIYEDSVNIFAERVEPEINKKIEEYFS